MMAQDAWAPQLDRDATRLNNRCGIQALHEIGNASPVFRSVRHQMNYTLRFSRVLAATWSVGCSNFMRRYLHRFSAYRFGEL